MSTGKIRVTVPIFLKNILENDILEFLTNKNLLMNQIYKNREKLDFEFNEKQLSYNNKETCLIQFQLTKENNSDFYDEKSKLKKLYKNFKTAEFFRQLLISYINLIKFKRELVIYNQHVKTLEKSIEIKKQIEITVRNKKFYIEPYFIASLEKENRNYFCCYSNHSKEYRNFRIASIEELNITNLDFRSYDGKYIELLKKNFDPFLSAGKKVKVKLTKNGQKKFERTISNRPRFLEKETEDIWLLEASEFKAEIYFSGFLNDVEILEPQSLRDNIKNKLEETLKLYKN